MLHFKHLQNSIPVYAVKAFSYMNQSIKCRIVSLTMKNIEVYRKYGGMVSKRLNCYQTR